jgi:hypothetical protein
MRAAAAAAIAEFDESLFVIVGHAVFIVFFWGHGVNGLLFLCAGDRMYEQGLQHGAKRPESVVRACVQFGEEHINDFVPLEAALASDLQAAQFGLAASMLFEKAHDVFARPKQRQNAILHASLDVCGKSHAYSLISRFDQAIGR